MKIKVIPSRTFRDIFMGYKMEEFVVFGYIFDKMY